MAATKIANSRAATHDASVTNKASRISFGEGLAENERRGTQLYK
jgi:hypothetical protein